MLWIHTVHTTQHTNCVFTRHWLFEAANPEPLAYLRLRGLTDGDARRFMLGYALADPDSLVRYLDQHCPELMPYAEGAGILSVDQAGRLRTHWNLRGSLIFPIVADGEIVDLRCREAEMAQCALRGRPLDHAEVQITILGSLPLPGLMPTSIEVTSGTPQSNQQRQQDVVERLCVAGSQLLANGEDYLSVQMLATHAGVSVTTVRTHWLQLAAHLGLEPAVQQHTRTLPNGSVRVYTLAVLLPQSPGEPEIAVQSNSDVCEIAATTDQARNMTWITGLIHHLCLKWRWSQQVQLQPRLYCSPVIRGPPT